MSLCTTGLLELKNKKFCHFASQKAYNQENKDKPALLTSCDKLPSFYFWRTGPDSDNSGIQQVFRVMLAGAADMAVHYQHRFEELLISRGAVCGVLEAPSPQPGPCACPRHHASNFPCLLQHQENKTSSLPHSPPLQEIVPKAILYKNSGSFTRVQSLVGINKQFTSII